jgi:hypothetical protein
VRKLVLATVEVHDDMEHRLELEESLYLALADYLQSREQKAARAQHRGERGIIRRGDRSENCPVFSVVSAANSGATPDRLFSERMRRPIK